MFSILIEEKNPSTLSTHENKCEGQVIRQTKTFTESKLG